MGTKTLTGWDAIEYAEEHNLTLGKHTDPTEDGREGLTPDEARVVASEDPALIYVETTMARGCGIIYGADGDFRIVAPFEGPADGVIGGADVVEIVAEELVDDAEADAMRDDMDAKTLTGWDAIEYAEEHGVSLDKYADPIEDARTGLTPDEAREVAREDPSLVYLELDEDGEARDETMEAKTKTTIVEDATHAAEVAIEQGFSGNPYEACAWASDIETCESKLGREMTREEGRLWLSTFQYQLAGLQAGGLAR